MNEEILAEVKIIVTYDIYKKFFLFSFFKGKSYKRKILLFYVFLFVGVSVSLWSGIIFGFDFMDMLLLASLIVLAMLISYLIIFAPKNYYKTAKKIVGNMTIYRFTSEYLEIEFKNESTNGKSVIVYDSFYKIYETDSDLYIYISNLQAYVVSKNDIPIDVMEQLRKIFKSKLGKKYHNYCK